MQDRHPLQPPTRLKECTTEENWKTTGRNISSSLSPSPASSFHSSHDLRYVLGIFSRGSGPCVLESASRQHQTIGFALIEFGLGGGQHGRVGAYRRMYIRTPVNFGEWALGVDWGGVGRRNFLKNCFVVTQSSRKRIRYLWPDPQSKRMLL